MGNVGIGQSGHVRSGHGRRAKERRAAMGKSPISTLRWRAVRATLRVRVRFEPDGIGVNTLTAWSTGRAGWRPADRWLRYRYPEVRNSVASPNSLFGSMALNGMSVLMSLRTIQRFRGSPDAGHATCMRLRGSKLPNALCNLVVRPRISGQNRIPAPASSSRSADFERPDGRQYEIATEGARRCERGSVGVRRRAG